MKTKKETGMKAKVLCAATLSALLLPGLVHADQVTLRLSHWVPATIAPASAGIEPWARSVEEASEGRIRVQIFPAQQIGAAPDHYDMARDGIADITWVNPGYTAGRFPIFALSEVPFHVSDSVAGAKAVHEWYQQYVPTEMSDVKFCVVHPHAPGALHSKRLMTVPSDIRGVNVRPAHATMARFISQLGGAPVQVPAPEAREALARGTADAVTFPWGSMYDFRLAPVTTYHLDMPFYISAQVLLINQRTYSRLSDANKAVLDEHCTPEWSARISEGWAADDASARERLMQDPTQTLHQPTDEEVALWREAAEGVLQAWKDEVRGRGHDAEAIYEAYLEALERNGARF